MTWAGLLLADASPCLRLLVLKELLGRKDSDSEIGELEKLREKDSIVSHLLALQSGDGSWTRIATAESPPGGRIHATSQALNALGYLGFDAEHAAVKRGVEYLFSKQRRDGSWPLPNMWERETPASKGYTMIPLQTALPLRGVAACGQAVDPRAERAYDWLVSQRLEDGSWPTGLAGDVLGRVAGYRRLPNTQWGCRTNTTAALVCLALHPKRRSGAEAQRALDLLLGRETRERQALGFEVARNIGAEPARGFLTYHARFDVALVLDLCWRVGAGIGDPRVADMLSYLKQVQGPYGLWEYLPRPEVSRWLTFDILRSLSHIDESGQWVTLEPRIRFRAYPKKRKRY